jgi:hypothetical protein
MSAFVILEGVACCLHYLTAGEGKATGHPRTGHEGPEGK